MIYFMREGEGGPVRIGWTVNLGLRCQAVRRPGGPEVTVIRLMEGSRRSVHWLHWTFASEREPGGLFRFSPLMMTVEIPDEVPDVVIPSLRPKAPPSRAVMVRLTASERAALKAVADIERRTAAQTARLAMMRGLASFLAAKET